MSTTAAYGVLYYAYGVLLVSMQHRLGWSRLFLTGALSAGLVVAAILAMPVGHWLDGHRAPPLFLVSSAVSVAGVAGWGLARNKIEFLASWIVIGASQAVLFYDAAFVVLTKWYRPPHRSQAMTNITLLGGLASTIFGPLTAALDSALGWRSTVLVLAAILGAVCSLCFGLTLNPPQATLAFPPGRHQPEMAVTRREALHSRPFWLIAAAYVLSAFTTFAVAVHLVAYLEGRHVTRPTAAAVLGGVGLAQVAGRGVFLRLVRHHSSLMLATPVLALKGFGITLLLVLPPMTGAVAFLLVYGPANGIANLSRATTLAELYGPDRYGAISSVTATTSGLSGALAPFGLAVIASVLHSEAVALWVLVALSGGAASLNHLAARVAEAPSQLSFMSPTRL